MEQTAKNAQKRVTTYVFPAEACMITGVVPFRPALRGQEQAPPAVPAPFIVEYKPRSTVSLVQGDNRQANVYKALMAVDYQVRAKLATASGSLLRAPG